MNSHSSAVVSVSLWNWWWCRCKDVQFVLHTAVWSKCFLWLKSPSDIKLFSSWAFGSNCWNSSINLATPSPVIIPLCRALSFVIRPITPPATFTYELFCSWSISLEENPLPGLFTTKLPAANSTFTSVLTLFKLIMSPKRTVSQQA